MKALCDYAKGLEVMCFVLLPFLLIMLNQAADILLLDRDNPLFGLMYEEKAFLIEVGRPKYVYDSFAFCQESHSKTMASLAKGDENLFSSYLGGLKALEKAKPFHANHSNPKQKTGTEEAAGENRGQREVTEGNYRGTTKESLA